MEQIQEGVEAQMSKPARRIPGLRKRVWISVRQPLARSALVNRLLPRLLAAYIRFTHRTNRIVAGSADPKRDFLPHAPAILAIWHGQHLTVPVIRSLTAQPVVALFSRSADAEMNARVAAEFDIEIVRGSGGRAGVNTATKGGVGALLALRKALANGKNVAMIADIAKGTPRESGMGIVALARASGRPILPLAYASSRRYVIEKSWDKTTINLPFGRAAYVSGEPVHVPGDADDAMMERKRRELTASLNKATEKAYGLVDVKP